METKDKIEILKANFPKFNKGLYSMAQHPEDYGICLTRKAKRILRRGKRDEIISNRIFTNTDLSASGITGDKTGH